MKKKAIKEFWLGFRQGDGFIGGCLKKDFGHVYILTKDEFNWLEIDPRNHAVEINILPCEAKADLIGTIQKEYGHHFIKVTVERVGRKWPNLSILNPLQCVGVIKYVLGVKMWRWTPYQLYKRLTKMGLSKKYSKNIVDIELLK